LGSKGPRNPSGIPAWCWWAVALLGLSLHLAFVLRGNLGLNKDLVFFSEQVRSYAAGSQGIREAGGLRFWSGFLFLRLAGDWPHFASLAALFLMAVPWVLLVRWTGQKICEPSAFFLALFLAVPPPAMAYYGVHLDERRMETIFWGILLLVSVEALSRSVRGSLLLGWILGWAFWGEPFILFFILPLWTLLSRYWGTLKRMAGPLAALLGGSALGLLMGWGWNVPFLRYYPKEYFHWGSAGGKDFHYHLDLLTKPFPQFWSGNFPFGYFQASRLGQASFPTERGELSPFLGGWFLVILLCALVGYGWTLWRDRKGSFPALCIMAPAGAFLVFFMVSSHVIDAMSFRYLAFLVPGLGFGCALAFGALHARRPKVGMAVLVLFLCLQGAVLGRFLLSLPKDFPSVRLAAGFERLGLEEGWANQWAALPARYLHGRRTWFRDHYDLLLPDRPLPEFRNDRIGLAHVPGLDQPEVIARTLRSLGGHGYRMSKEWPMVEGWTILELRRSPAPRASR